MKNPNSPFNRLKAKLKIRWSEGDYPGGQTRFQLRFFLRDVFIFILLPLITVIIYRAWERSGQPQKKQNQNQQTQRDLAHNENQKSQIIDFKTLILKGSAAKHSPGTLVKVRLLNVVETYSDAPVHAQIVDDGLGKQLRGGTLIGDATPDTTFERISIVFHYARDPYRESVAFPISARALSLDGTMGIVASKKEEFFTRSVLGSASGASQNGSAKGDSNGDIRDILFRALAAGFVQEFSNGGQVEKNRSQVLTLQANTEFFAELTDFFPGGTK